MDAPSVLSVMGKKWETSMWIKFDHVQEAKRYRMLEKKLTSNGTAIYPGLLLQRAARDYPEIAALIVGEREISYRELYERVCYFATTLRSGGIRAGDRVLICFENVPEFYVAYYAVWHLGAVVTPLNTFLHEKELAHVVKDASASHVITASDRVDAFTKHDGLKKEHIFTEADIAIDGPVSANSLDETIAEIPVDQMAALLYTSGTTGLPKGVMLSGTNIITSILQGASRLPFQRERVLGVLPLFHSFAQSICLWCAVHTGSTVILVKKIDRRRILDGLAHRPTAVLGVPALYGLFCLLRAEPMEQVRIFVSGGDALPDRIRSIFGLLYRRKLCNGYGLTETSPFISVDLEGVFEPTSNVGNPMHGVEVKITDEEGKLTPGKTGLLWVRGANVMLGYYNAPDETAKVLVDGWLNTGDLAYIDEHGKVVITGRLKDLIINKGLNIYPQEIENVIVSHSNVLRVGVVGRQHDTEGEIPVAFVQLRKTQENVEAELKALCSQHLAPYKVPRSFICSTEQLEVTATGKVDKKVLRKRLSES